jgi:AcrR family transcriptional regulator
MLATHQKLAAAAPFGRLDENKSVTTTDSQDRILAAAKGLFARLGFEATSTAAIARTAGTSESQLVRGFSSKAGLLDAVFDVGWRGLNARVQDVITDATDGRGAVVRILTAMLAAFERDPDLATVMLLEGRRIRGNSHEVTVSTGFRTFTNLVQRLIRRGQKDGSFAPEYDAAALSCALIGAVEGMVRERVIARRAGAQRPFSDRQVLRIFEALLDSFAPGA